jgi:hypothetical protein
MSPRHTWRGLAPTFFAGVEKSIVLGKIGAFSSAPSSGGPNEEASAFGRLRRRARFRIRKPLALHNYRLTALVSVNIKIGVVGLPKRDSALGFYCACKLS